MYFCVGGKGSWRCFIELPVRLYPMIMSVSNPHHSAPLFNLNMSSRQNISSPVWTVPIVSHTRVQLASPRERKIGIRIHTNQHIGWKLLPRTQQEVSLTVTGQFFLRPPHLLIIIAKMQQHCGQTIACGVFYFLHSPLLLLVGVERWFVLCFSCILLRAPVAAPRVWKTNGKVCVRCAPEINGAVRVNGGVNETKTINRANISRILFVIRRSRVREAKANRPRSGSWHPVN